jgi:hypothetical protein
MVNVFNFNKIVNITSNPDSYIRPPDKGSLMDIHVRHMTLKPTIRMIKPNEPISQQQKFTTFQQPMSFDQQQFMAFHQQQPMLFDQQQFMAFQPPPMMFQQQQQPQSQQPMSSTVESLLIAANMK